MKNSTFVIIATEDLNNEKKALEIVSQLQGLNKTYFSNYSENQKVQMGSFMDNLNAELELLGYLPQYGRNMKVEKKLI